MTRSLIGLLAAASLLSLSLEVQAQYQQQHAPQYQQHPAPVTRDTGADVEYNATDKSPTLPLVQTPPSDNSPSAVYVGQPNYYYYNYPMSYGGYGPGYGTVPQVGGIVTNAGGQSRRTFWFNTPIPGQVAPASFVPGFYGPGSFPTGNSVFIP